MRPRYTIGIFLLAFLSACSLSTQQQGTEKEENSIAKTLLQGMWMDDVTDEPVFQIQGDTIYYSNPSIVPIAFKVIDDSLITYGSQPIGYHIEKQDEYTLWVQSVLGDILHLKKAETSADSLKFSHAADLSGNIPDEVITKDRIVFYDKVRYRGYVYINPSSYKVTQSTLSKEGLEVDNIYYDNIIHICVYNGKKKLFAKDIHKQDFEGIIPDDFYPRTILSDMEFIDVTAEGYHYQATVCIPNGASCYLVNLLISPKGEITYELAE